MENPIPHSLATSQTMGDIPVRGSNGSCVRGILCLSIKIGGFLAAVMTLILGIVRLPLADLELFWPSGSFCSDVNAETWRKKLFSLTPEVLIDVWTPFFWGLASILIHFIDFDTPPLTGTSTRYLLWNLTQALWANFGYAGGLGIIVGGLSTLIALLCAIARIIRAFPNDSSFGMRFRAAHATPDMKRIINVIPNPPYINSDYEANKSFANVPLPSVTPNRNISLMSNNN